MHDRFRQDCPDQGAVATDFTKDWVGQGWLGRQFMHDRSKLEIKGFLSRAVLVDRLVRENPS